MYMRIVEAGVHQSETSKLEYVYTDLIIPVLEETEGCIFAGLLKNLEEPKKYISLTIWDQPESAEKYVASGKFEQNVDQVRPLLEGSTEWKIELTRDNMIEYTPVSTDPVVKSYPVDETENPLSEKVSQGRSFLHIISHKVQEGAEHNFSDIFLAEILPELKKMEGCKYAFLVDNSDNDGEMLSFSIWDSLTDINRYEEGGTLDRFLGKIRHTLGDLYQWKMALNNSTSAKTITSQDIGIGKYTLITGKKFQQ